MSKPVFMYNKILLIFIPVYPGEVELELGLRQGKPPIAVMARRVDRLDNLLLDVQMEVRTVLNHEDINHNIIIAWPILALTKKTKI